MTVTTNITPHQAIKKAISVVALGTASSATDLCDAALELCPYATDSDEGQEWIDTLENILPTYLT